jgi:hypothetical protein
VKVTKLSLVIAVALGSATVHAATSVAPSFQLVAGSTSQEQLPSIAVDAKGTVAIWGDSATRAGRATTTQPVSQSLDLAEGPYRAADAAAMGNESMVIWLRNDDLFAQRVGGDGKPIGAPIYIAFTDSRHANRVAIAASRDRYLILFNASSRILGSILDANGQILDYGISITNGEFGRNVERVSLASNGDEFLVVWDASTSEPWVTPCTLACPAEDRDVHAVVIGHDGHPRPETERVLASAAGDPDVASNGRDYFVCWARFDGGLTGQAIAASGAVLGDPITITTRRDYGPHLAWDGASYDLAWINDDKGTVLMTERLNEAGIPIENILRVPYGGFRSRDFDMAAGGGRIAFAIPTEGHLRLQYVTVTTVPSGRARAVRH